VRLFIDESLSPLLATRCNEPGRHDAVHPLHIGRRGEPDHRVLTLCISEDRVIVTQNARDFRRLVSKAEVHSGLIILPFATRDVTWELLQAAITCLETKGDPMDVMVNHMLVVATTG
jgi:predicted nuclease of predicted toxin-antitoxin system